MATAIPASPIDGITRIQRDRFSPRTGLRVGLVVVIPVAACLAANLLVDGALITLGAYYLCLVDDPPPTETLPRKLLLAAALNATAFGLGSMASLSFLLSIPLTALGVVMLSLLSAFPELYRVSFIGSFSFVAGVGLGGQSLAQSEVGFALVLAGGAWAVLLAALHLRVERNLRYGRGFRFGGGAPAPPEVPLFSSFHLSTETWRRALVVAAMATLGLAVVRDFDLARGFWVMVTVVAALNAVAVPLVTNVFLRVGGTIGGALVGYLIVTEVTEPWWLVVVLFGCIAAAFAIRFVNLGLLMVALTPYLLIVQNILFPGSAGLAFVRVEDVMIGGGLAILGGILLWLAREAKGNPRGGGDGTALTPSDWKGGAASRTESTA